MNTTQTEKPKSLATFESLKQFKSYAEKHEAKSGGRILSVFMHTDMRYGHDGLEQLAKSRNIDVKSLTPGQYVVFVNQGQNRLKVFAANEIVAYMRLPQGRKVDLRIIQEIPRAFNATGRIDADHILKEAIESALLRQSVKK